MSNRQPSASGVRFEPVLERLHVRPGERLLIFGVIFPAIVIAIELASGWCADSFFDPMPTAAHVVAVCLVPASNLLVWMHLQYGVLRGTRSLAFLNGAGIAIGGFYAFLFLPLLPIAIIGIVFAIGLLPFAPLASFVFALKLRRSLRAAHKDQALNRVFVGGIAAGIAFLLALDIPVAATRLGIEWAASTEPSQRERGLTLLRTLGDDDLLLRLCYGITGKSSGLIGALALFSGDGIWLDPPQRQQIRSPVQARELYYQIHGVAFNTRPAPFAPGRQARFADFQFDDDHGGAEVGGRLRGLSMVASRIDGSISGDDAVAYLEWTVEFRNTGAMDRETRLQFALPPGGVVSRATLWVNGEEREAAYGGRGEVRAAYQRVAVQQRRDPLLVTTKGADRVLAQAFPVPRNGTIKFKIGITAPLEINEASKARLVLPAIVDRNFSFAPDFRHSVWIEGKRPLATSAPGLAVSRTGTQLFRLAGEITDRDLARPRQIIAVDRNPATGGLAARIGDGDVIVQEVIAEAPQAPATLLLVIDGSARLRGAIPQLIAALDTIPPAMKVGAIVASEPAQRVSPAPWSDAQKQAVVTLLRSASFVGGQDNAPALADALQTLESEPTGVLLWIHGPQPVRFRADAARLEQATDRLSWLPKVVLYGVEPGPNEVLPDAPWGWGARSLPQTQSVRSDLAGFFTRVSGQSRPLAVRRTKGDAASELPKGSDHIARLWASDRVLELMRSSPTFNRPAAVKLAADYRLVTPVSGAVVLETKQQYDENRLTPVSDAMVPTIPEPHEWALALIACAMLGWLAWRNRQRFAAAA